MIYLMVPFPGTLSDR